MKKDIEIQMFRRRILIIIISLVIILGVWNLFLKSEKRADTTEITLGSELWTTTIYGKPVYCVQRNKDFKGNITATVTTKTITSSSSIADKAVAYVLGKGTDTVWSDSKMNSNIVGALDSFYDAEISGDTREGKKAFKNGIHKVTSIKQNAIWTIKGVEKAGGATPSYDGTEEEFLNNTYWKKSKDANDNTVEGQYMVEWHRSNYYLRLYPENGTYKYWFFSTENSPLTSTQLKEKVDSYNRI